MLTEKQFSPLAEKYMDMIFRLSFSYLKNSADADDVTQNVLFSLYKTDKAFQSDDHLKNWLIRVTINECRKHWRSPWNRTADFDDYANTLCFEETRFSDLFQAIIALDKKHRVVIVLYYYEGYSIAEIAKLLNIPVGTAGTRLSRARSILKNDLTEAYQYE